MSLLWPNQHQLLVAIGAEHISLAYCTGFSKKVITKHYENFQQSSAGLSWKKAIDQLDIQLESLKLPRNTSIWLTLASDVVRVIVLPEHEIAMSSSEKEGYAQAAYREIYGAVVDNWKISIDDTPPMQPTLACAIDKTLYDALENLAIKYQLRLKSVQPYIMTAFNRLFSSIKKASASLVLIEQTRITTLFLKNGICQQVQIEKFNHDWQSNLEQSLIRNQLLSDQTSNELLIYAPALNSIKLEFSKHFSAKRLNIKNNNFAMVSGFSMLEALA